MQVYVNYPHPHITIHENDLCQQVRMNQKEEQRSFTVRPGNAEILAAQFLSEKFAFESANAFKDLWFDISLATPEQEVEFVHRFQMIVGQRYRQLSHAPTSLHCECADCEHDND